MTSCLVLALHTTHCELPERGWVTTGQVLHAVWIGWTMSGTQPKLEGSGWSKIFITELKMACGFYNFAFEVLDGG